MRHLARVLFLIVFAFALCARDSSAGVAVGVGVSASFANANGSVLAFSVDFTAQTPGAAATLPTWLSGARASTRYVQTSASTQSASISSGSLAIGQPAGATTRGLIVERGTTNVVTAPNSFTNAVWTNSGTLTSGVTGPDGTASAWHFVEPASAGQTYQSISLAASTLYQITIWGQQSSLSAYDGYVFNGTATHFGTASGLTSAWQRLSYTYMPVSVSSPLFVVADGFGAPGAINANLSDAQVEAQPYPTSYTDSTRAPERLYTAAASSVVFGGRLMADIAFVPEWGTAQLGQAGDAAQNRRLWTVSAIDFCEIDGRHLTVRCEVGGTPAVFSTLLAWNSLDQVVVHIEAGNGTPLGWYTVNGGSQTDLGAPAGITHPYLVTEDAPIDWACDDTSGTPTTQLDAYVQSIKVYSHGSAGPGTTYYASTTGSGTTCSKASPCSLASAQTKAQSSGGARVLLRSGTYYLGSTFALTAADNGTTYQAYPREVPVLSGGTVVTGWSNDGTGRGVYQATYAGSTRDVWVQGLRATPVRSAQVTNASWGDPATLAISSTTNTSPIVVTTSAAHGRSTGDVVRIAGTVDAAAIGVWTVTMLSSTSFSLATYPSGAPSVGTQAGGAFGTVILLTGGGLTAPDSSFGSLAVETDAEFVFRSAWKQMRARLASASGTAVVMRTIDWVNAEAKAGFVADAAHLLWWQGADELFTSSNTYADPALLAAGGVWNLASGSGKLKYKPRSGEDMSTALVVAGNLQTLVSVTGTSGARATPTFRGIAFAETTWLDPSTSGYTSVQTGMIGFDPTSAEHPSATQIVATQVPGAVVTQYAAPIFAGCTFMHHGGTGLALETGTQGAVVEGSTFTDCGAAGVMVGNASTSADWAPSSTVDWVSGNTVRRSYFVTNGATYTDNAHLFIGYASSTAITQNTFGAEPISAVAEGWGWGTLNASPNGVLAGNAITGNYATGIRTPIIGSSFQSDLGVLYVVGTHGSPGTVVSGNYVVANSSDDGAVYLDAGANGELVTGNVLSGGVFTVLIPLNQTPGLQQSSTDSGNFYAGSSALYQPSTDLVLNVFSSNTNSVTGLAALAIIAASGM